MISFDQALLTIQLVVEWLFFFNYFFSVNQPCWNFWRHCYWLPVRHEQPQAITPYVHLWWVLMLFLAKLFCRYVECTSAAIQALTSFKKLYPRHRREEIEHCISKAATFLEKIQELDGSWLVCYLMSFVPSIGKTENLWHKRRYLLFTNQSGVVWSSQPSNAAPFWISSQVLTVPPVA